MMELKIKIVSRSGHVPSYETEGSAGADLRAWLPEGPVTLQPGERRLIPTGLFVELPPGIEAQIRARSGLSIKHGITMINGVGTVDSDYRGEWNVPLVNLGQEAYTIQVTKLQNPTAFALNTDKLVIYEGCDAYVEDYRLQPYPSIIPTVSWESSNEDAVLVDQSGGVTARKPGTAVLTATTDGGLSDSLEVTVLPAPQDADTFGNCGATLLYTCANGVLTVTGSGDMWDSWCYDKCHRVLLPEGLTGISSYAFSDSDVETLEIPSSTRIIGVRAFAWSKLEQIRFLGSAPTIQAGAFEELTLTAYYPQDDPSWTEAVMQDYGGSVTWIPYASQPQQGCTLTGSLTTFCEGDALLELLQDDEILACTTVSETTGSYTLAQLPMGSYTLRVSKAGHVTRTYRITLEAEAAAQDVKLHLKGDISGDGKINLVDMLLVKSFLLGDATFNDTQMSAADMNRDDKVNLMDVYLIKSLLMGA